MLPALERNTRMNQALPLQQQYSPAVIIEITSKSKGGVFIESSTCPGLIQADYLQIQGQFKLSSVSSEHAANQLTTKGMTVLYTASYQTDSLTSFCKLEKFSIHDFMNVCLSHNTKIAVSSRAKDERHVCPRQDPD